MWRKWSQVLQQSKQRQRRRALRARADLFFNDHKVNLDVLGLQDQQEDFVVPFGGRDYSLWEGWKGKTCGDEQHSTNIFFWVIPQATSQKRFILWSPFDQCARKEKACMFEWCWLCLLCSLCCLWLILQKGLQKNLIKCERKTSSLFINSSTNFELFHFGKGCSLSMGEPTL